MCMRVRVRIASSTLVEHRLGRGMTCVDAPTTVRATFAKVSIGNTADGSL